MRKAAIFSWRTNAIRPGSQPGLFLERKEVEMKIKLKTIAICALMLLSVMAPAGAQTFAPGDPRTTLFSADMLRKALADIARMQEPELRALLHCLAECEDQVGDIGEHFCSAARTAYEIEFGSEFDSKRPIDLMLFANSGTKAWFTAHPETLPKTAAQMVDEATKSAMPMAALEHGVGDRLRSLKRTRPTAPNAPNPPK
jgi:hypothetical protein